MKYIIHTLICGSATSAQLQQAMGASMNIIVNYPNEGYSLSEDTANELIAELLIRWIGNREKKEQQELYPQLIKYLEELIKEEETS